MTTRQLVVGSGDQLDRDYAAFDGFEPRQDVARLAEAHPESTRAWSSLPRTAMSLAVMRHCAVQQRAQGRRVVYRALRERLRTAGR